MLFADMVGTFIEYLLDQPELHHLRANGVKISAHTHPHDSSVTVRAVKVCGLGEGILTFVVELDADVIALPSQYQVAELTRALICVQDRLREGVQAFLADDQSA